MSFECDDGRGASGFRTEQDYKSFTLAQRLELLQKNHERVEQLLQEKDGDGSREISSEDLAAIGLPLTGWERR